MAKKIIWSRLAQNDRKAILQFWIDHNKSNTFSIKLNQFFIDTIDLLSKHPNIGKKTEFPDIRIKIVKHYFITYRITENSIEILTIWDSRQNPTNFQRII